MASSFFSDFGLMWYLEELRKKEFMKFKELLKQETLQLGLKQIPWAEVKKASREDLANLLITHYEEQGAWDVTFRIFQKIDRKDLCEKARRESAGHTKMYQDHIKKKFGDIWFRESITMAHECVDQKVTQVEHEFLEALFALKETGKQSRTLFLMGLPGIGKTTLLIKLMLAWSHGNLYQDRFSYVFYFCCREVKQLMAMSLADLISRDWPNSSVPITEILSQPQKLLFIIDSFEEMKSDLSEPESELCSDWMEKQPVRLLLSSLLRKKLLPESSLFITVTPGYPQGLEDRLEHPDIRTLMGFNESDKKMYFCSLFPDRNRALQAFSCVRENIQLFSMCEIPLLCWVICTCLKQEMERGRDLALTCRCTTSLFSSFIFNLFTPKGASRPNQQSQGQLTGLCSLAAEGIWTDMFMFTEEDLRRNGILDSDIPTLLDIKVLRKCRESEKSYAFIHLFVQELCAAMFYLIKSHSDHPSPAVQCPEMLLATFLRKVEARWMFLGCFMSGLLHEKEQQKLDAFFGVQLSHKIQQHFYQYLQTLCEYEDLQEQVNFMALFYCLFEMQDEAFVSQAMGFFQEIHFSISKNSDLEVSAYCLRHCPSLRKLGLSVHNVFKEEKEHSSVSNYSLVCWHQICSLLTTHEHLQGLQVKDSDLSETAVVILCNQLRQPNCVLQELEINNVGLYCENYLFFEVFMHNPNLKDLNFSRMNLSRDDVKLLCDVLNHPTCNIEKLLLAKCIFSSEDCEDLASVLLNSRKLNHLHITGTNLDNGVRSLFTALCHPDCALETLVLTCCQLSGHCWADLSEVLLTSKTLSFLDLSANELKDEGLRMLCEALRHPDCSLQSLCLVNCLITTDSCQALASVLSSNQNLKNLQIGGNKIEDAGVKLLCKALIHPNSCLESLGLEACGLTSACCEDLASALTHCKTLWGLNLMQNALDRSGVVVLCEALRQPGCSLKVLGLQKDEFDEETWALLMVAEERNTDLTIVER